MFLAHVWGPLKYGGAVRPNWFNIVHGKTTVSVLHDAQLLLNKQQQIWVGVYIH